ncbi:MAG: SCP2 sterol-binding domain-containing protein [Myxococcota bacterium]
MQAAPSKLDRFFADAAHRAAVGRAIPDGSVIRFELSGPGGGVWCLGRRGQRVHLLGHPHPRADCLLKCSVGDFTALITGRLNPRDGFMGGQLEVTGDVGIVLGLHRALRSDDE